MTALSVQSVMASNHPYTPIPKDAPLWRRTELRLQNMALFTAQRTPSELGSITAIRLREEIIEREGKLLVMLLKEWEEQKEAESRLS